MPNDTLLERSRLADILEDPSCGNALKEELEGYWSLRVGRSRITYRLLGREVEIVAIGPRETIYEEATRRFLRNLAKS
jgi:mRNA-degrading endonuclease RelE of RelBE toxin-antitoxin system